MVNQSNVIGEILENYVQKKSIILYFFFFFLISRLRCHKLKRELYKFVFLIRDSFEKIMAKIGEE